MRKLKAKGQSLAELALCLAVMSAVIIAMRLYLIRAFQAKYKQGTSYVFSKINEQAASQGQAGFSDAATQYDPYYSESTSTQTTDGSQTGGFPDSSVDQIITRSGVQSVGVPRHND